MATVTLRAVELLSKEGFEDGGVLDDLLEAGGWDALADPLDEEAYLDPRLGGAVLCECVRRFLAPSLLGFEIDYDLSIAHNPVRLSRWGEPGTEVLRDVLEGLEVTLEEGQVLAVAQELAHRFENPRPGTGTAIGRT